MRLRFVSVVVSAVCILGACDKSADTGHSAASTPIPMAQAAMTAWRRGDKSDAIKAFVAADWNARPLFRDGSLLNLTEGQFQLFHKSTYDGLDYEANGDLSAVNRLSLAAIQAGEDAAEQGDLVQARKYFTAVKNCGTALNNPNNLRILQVVGQSLIKVASIKSPRTDQ